MAKFNDGPPSSGEYPDYGVVFTTFRKEVIEMYSPKISEDLIHTLYFAARAKGIPMTRLVDSLIRDALAYEYLPKGTEESQADSAAPTESSRNVA